MTICNATLKLRTAELHSPELTVKAKQPDMQKIRIIGFFFESRLDWQFEVEKYFHKRLLWATYLFT